MMKFIGFNKDEKGQSLVEFALILPIFLLLIIGIVDFGWIFFNQSRLTNAAREGARVYAVDKTLTEAQVEDLTEGFVDVNNFQFPPVAVASTTTVEDVDDPVAYVEITGRVKPLTGLLQGSILNLKGRAHMRLEHN